MAQDTTGWSEMLKAGGEPLDVTAPAAEVGSVPFVTDGFFLVPKGSADSGAPVACVTDGVWRLPKTTPLVITAGDQVYWNDTTKKVTKTATDTPIGKCHPGLSAGSSDTTVVVILQPGGSDAMDVITDHIADTVGAHAATAISITPPTHYTETDVGSLLATLAGKVYALEHP